MTAPLVSVIVPCRNESRFIAGCLESILATEYPKDRLEILVVDGMSEDGTRRIVETYARRHPQIATIENPARTAATAMNAGIRRASGDIVMRMDAHAAYPSGYIPRLVKRLLESGADNVGSVCWTRPADVTPKAVAIALGLSHPFGVGNSHFRIGSTAPRWVDTVPFGCFRREVFERIGLFDEELIRNQDDEFNLRLIRSGGRILLVPDVRCEYFARDTLLGLWRMFYEYGLYKPLVAWKVRRVMTVRQLVPAAALASFVVLTGLSPWSRLARLVLSGGLTAYAALTVLAAIGAAPRHGLKTARWLTAVFPVLHGAYGLGYLHGLLNLLFRERPQPVPLALKAVSRPKPADHA